jgi:hypothetical protein
MRYRIAYVEGIRPAQDAQPLRLGTNYHAGLEVLEMSVGKVVNLDASGVDSQFVTEENRLELAVEVATSVYTTIPDWADATEWAVEREIVANALEAYHWLYPSGSSEYETVATELQFDLPLVNPETGRPTPSFRRVGKIDRIIRSKATGRLLVHEYKSSSKPIDSGSTYWQRLRKDTQSKFYILAARDVQGNQDLKELGIYAEDRTSGNMISGLLHDVFHKPGIAPKKLTQAESAEFVKTGDYCGQHFEVETIAFTANSALPVDTYEVDGVQATIELGAVPKPKKDGTQAPPPFAIRETPGMYGARLLQDMTTRPEYYFARREVAFTDDELKAFEYQIWALQRNMAEMEKSGHWFENEQQCEATFKCAYCSLCYNNVDVFHGQTPPGFKRLHAEAVEQAEIGEVE